MTANVNFVYADRENTLRVPNAALRFRPTGELQASTQGGAGTTTPHQASLVDAAPSSLTGGGESNRRTVWVLHGDRPIPVTVQLGVTDGTFSEVTSSELHEADRVVTDIVGDAADVTARRSRADALRRMF